MSANGLNPHRYKDRCPCVLCCDRRDRSPGNAQMRYQRRLAMEREQAARRKALSR